MAPAYEFIEHTADAGLRARGRDLPELFINVIKGMTALMADIDQIEPLETREISVEAEDRESLLVEWLNETIYLIETENLIFSRFYIERMTDTTLQAKIAGEQLDETRHRLKTQIKAVTYHDLKVEKTEFGWFAQVIFDV